MLEELSGGNWMTVTLSPRYAGGAAAVERLVRPFLVLPLPLRGSRRLDARRGGGRPASR